MKQDIISIIVAILTLVLVIFYQKKMTRTMEKLQLINQELTENRFYVNPSDQEKFLTIITQTYEKR